MSPSCIVPRRCKTTDVFSLRILYPSQWNGINLQKNKFFLIFLPFSSTSRHRDSRWLTDRWLNKLSFPPPIPATQRDWAASIYFILKKISSLWEFWTVVCFYILFFVFVHHGPPSGPRCIALVASLIFTPLGRIQTALLQINPCGKAKALLTNGSLLVLKPRTVVPPFYVMQQRLGLLQWQ